MDALRFRRSFARAIRQSGLPPRQRLAARLALTVPAVEGAVMEHIEDVSGSLELGDGELLKLIIENLPEILELIMTLITMFG